MIRFGTFLVSTVVVKALIMAASVLAFAASEPFWHQIALTLISAITTGAFVLGAARIAAASHRSMEDKIDRNRDQMVDVKRKLGADRREADDSGST